jgi:hypothetical protein
MDWVYLDGWNIDIAWTTSCWFFYLDRVIPWTSVGTCSRPTWCLYILNFSWHFYFIFIQYPIFHIYMIPLRGFMEYLFYTFTLHQSPERASLATTDPIELNTQLGWIYKQLLLIHQHTALVEAYQINSTTIGGIWTTIAENCENWILTGTDPEWIDREI